MNLRTVAIAISILALIAGVLGRATFSPAPFDRAIWLQSENAKTSSDAPRLSMADGLVSSRALLGKSQSEVEAMLGAPTQTNKFRDYDLVYWLGAERGYISIDSEWLVVRFDKTSKASEAKIVRD
jgi:hypothetical protein